MKLKRFVFVLLLIVGPRVALAQNPAQVGQWSTLYTWPTVSVHQHLLPDGRALSFAGTVVPPTTPAWVVTIPLDQAPGSQVSALMKLSDSFCSGHSFLADGRLLALGGGGGSQTMAIANANTFDFQTGSWSAATSMHYLRWYPTALTLADGSILVLGGKSPTSSVVNIPEVTHDGGVTWQALTSAPYPGSNGGYRRAHVAPDGRVFVSGPQTQSYFLSQALSLWTNGPVSHTRHQFGGSVIYDDGKVMLVGGVGSNNTATSVAEITDLTQPSPVWTLTGSMNFARQWNSTTVLPDGSVFVNGGSSSAKLDCATAVLQSELWSPQTAQWTVMASEAHPRLEHSTAILLADGRVLSSGGTVIKTSTGGVCGPYQDAQIFSPPYLFKGARPTITSAPADVTYGQQFLVGTPNTDVVSVTWIRLSSVTHINNQNQRLTRPAFAPAVGGLQVTAPVSPNLAPPGHYMMFLINSAGVPSYASMIHIS